jgi:hypothetical protein
MCIVNSYGFEMDWALEAQIKAQVEANSTFGNIKGANLFKVVEEAIKQMKRLQNLRTMDDDRIGMEYIEHQGEDMTNIENNPSKKEKEERIEKMSIEAMAIHELLAKNFFKVHLKKMVILPS